MQVSAYIGKVKNSGGGEGGRDCTCVLPPFFHIHLYDLLIVFVVTSAIRHKNLVKYILHIGHSETSISCGENLFCWKYNDSYKDWFQLAQWPCFWFSQNEMKIVLYKSFPTAFILQSLAPTFTVPYSRQKIFQNFLFNEKKQCMLQQCLFPIKVKYFNKINHKILWLQLAK